MTTLAELYPEIRAAANIVHRKWPTIIDAEDVAQTIALRMSESPNSILKFLEQTPETRKAWFIRMGHQVAAQERTDLDYFHGSFRYSVDEVKNVLSRGGLIDTLPEFDVQVHDLTVALEDLAKTNQNYASAIYQRYVLEVQPDKNHLSRGLEKLTTLMNKSRAQRESEFANGARGRTSVSNQEGLNLVDSDYNGREAE